MVGNTSAKRIEDGHLHLRYWISTGLVKMPLSDIKPNMLV